MMDFPGFAARSLLVFVLLGVCSLGPGLFFVRRLRWSPLETLCASIAASVLFTGLGSAAIYWLNLRPVSSWHWGLTGVCLALDLACLRDIRRLFRRTLSRRALVILATVLFWFFLLLLVIRNYGGGLWWGDWLEHYQRSMFFVQRWPLDHQFLDHYGFADRPPLMNLVCAHYLAQAGQSFALYQWVAVFLNAMPVLPCCLFGVSLCTRSATARRALWGVLPLFLIANPFFVENVTYTWTKSGAAFFALLGLWFYIRGWLRGDGKRITAGFFLASAACMVHMSMSAVAIALAIHYMLAVWRRRPRRLSELATIIILCAILPAAWFGWSIATYGGLAASGNRLFRPFEGNLEVSTPARIRVNAVTTIVPYFMLSPPYYLLRQPSDEGFARDLTFSAYQLNAIFALGVFGALVLVYALWSGRLTWRAWPDGLRRFWCAFLVLSGAIGVCGVPRPEFFGAAQLAVLPQLFLALPVIAAVFVLLPTAWKVLAIMGLMVDFLLGVLLQLHLERRVFQVVAAAGSDMVQVPDGDLSHAAVSNAVLKWKQSVQMIGDSVYAAGPAIEAVLVLVFVLLLARAAYAAGVTE